jgi:hypothetical protein
MSAQMTTQPTHVGSQPTAAHRADLVALEQCYDKAVPSSSQPSNQHSIMNYYQHRWPDDFNLDYNILNMN